MSAIELFLAIAFGIPICVALCCLFFAITYYQVIGQMKSPKEDKELKFNTLSRHEMQASTDNLLKQDKKRRRRARYVTRQQANKR